MATEAFAYNIGVASVIAVGGCAIHTDQSLP
jgi:hypothetical protein